jgi:hypothetical protein
MAVAVTVRMYNQLKGGDCSLLSFINGKEESFVLIDFGTEGQGNEERELEIANNIYKTVGDKPLVIIITQQRRDHISGFVSAERIIRKLNICGLWLSFPDETNGKEAQSMRGLKETLWNKNLELKERARSKFGDVDVIEKMLDAQDVIDETGENQTGAMVIKTLVNSSGQMPKHLAAGEFIDLPGFPKNSVRVYVAGPTHLTEPSKATSSNGHSSTVQSPMAKMRNLEASSGLMFDALNIDSAGINQSDNQDFPFNKKFIQPISGGSVTIPVVELYYNTDEWRRIDHVWLNEMGRISLQLDELSRNNDRVLAFELKDHQKVLLFAADTGIENWETWGDFQLANNNIQKNGNNPGLKIADLLNRVVLYKTGCYPVDNSRLEKSIGLMNKDELVIMIQANEESGREKNLPTFSQELLNVYNRMSEGRILRSDTIYHTAKLNQAYKFPFASTAYNFPSAVKVEYDRVNENHLYVEYTIQ